MFLLLILFIPCLVTGTGLEQEEGEWNPLSIELGTSSSDVLEKLEEEGANFLRLYRIGNEKVKDAARVFTIDWKNNNTYLMVGFDNRQVTYISLYLPYDTTEDRTADLDAVWEYFLNLDNNKNRQVSMAQDGVWIHAVVPYEDYTWGMGVNGIPITDYGPWAILLKKYNS